LPFTIFKPPITSSYRGIKVKCFWFPAVPYCLLILGSSEHYNSLTGWMESRQTNIMSQYQYLYQEFLMMKFLVLGLFSSSAILSGVLDYQQPDFKKFHCIYQMPTAKSSVQQSTVSQYALLLLKHTIRIQNFNTDYVITDLDVSFIDILNDF